jgi:hypothetical protein
MLPPALSSSLSPSIEEEEEVVVVVVVVTIDFSFTASPD